MDTSIGALARRRDTLYVQILGVKHHRSDLMIMLRNVEKHLTALSKEEINCRRFSHITLQYKELAEMCEEAMQVLEKYIVFARLTQG